MTLYIKNMVCPRCIMAVRNILVNRGVEIVHIQLGKVVINRDLSKSELDSIAEDLRSIGFELLDDEQKRLIEQIKVIIIEQIQQSENNHVVFSELLTDRLHRDYSYLSKLFSSTEGITIEQYTILQKVEKVKELLSYDQLNLSEIAFRMGYSSVAHLSSQFKKVTGLTPSQFKTQSSDLRKPLDDIL
ncbi:AraC family transcriptional regulator [Dysgonomonas sp. 520]|uniref:helix-turn-helix domain-containing protein n=1 Tax=Dysgonomonas sp. 520 TaxID=2302931 RepID=UPI0013D1F4BA|nr:AraC family transcriptional regulator [Dysgonomonas sp. 520]NDW09299.1 AraC family transcriptional regulator [Dysgonomonas sp. 520]